MPVEVIVVVAVLGFAVWWCVLIWSISWLTGWRTLARHYHFTGPFHGRKHRFQHLRLGWSSYSGCVTVGSNADGLSLAVMFLFRPGHQPLFIPWSVVRSAEFVRKWYGSWLELRTTAAPWVRLRLPERLGKRLAADANQSWAAAEAGVE
ncbi:MAG TPA: hypothetical protein VD866_13525 [Urbifossiella sp.]|nr:hypothetical protein [Urbifossiella sp.]